ncbi:MULTISPECIES: hypothetical protein [Actinomadura]|uniref:Polysaccharide chain length determinant N-terminal domain-containing protein n=1 Tax=Actinomadura yumaensis TaxID=111807 RepID=A0ABW2C9Z4_9ACTN|nr:hypothetical protein [Actinomadura sp. J1-007]MWK33710.1 hypothetical protein [Actinomadura sp. J1-007]
MTFRDFFVSVRRRPLVTLIMAALTGLVALQTLAAAPSYEARAVLTFLSPQPSSRNTFATFPPFLVLMAEVSARGLDSPAGRRAVRRAGGRAGFQVALANRGSQEVPVHDQPYVTISSASTRPAEARRTLQAVEDVLRDELRRRQVEAGARGRSVITWRVTESTRDPIAITGMPTRRLAAILLMGAIATVYAAVLADRRAPRLNARTPWPRTRRRPRETPDPTTP